MVCCGLDELIGEMYQMAQVPDRPIGFCLEDLREALHEAALVYQHGDNGVAIVQRHNRGQNLVHIIVQSVVPFVSK